jgi:hypothetical protein
MKTFHFDSKLGEHCRPAGMVPVINSHLPLAIH